MNYINELDPIIIGMLTTASIGIVLILIIFMLNIFELEITVQPKSTNTTAIQMMLIDATSSINTNPITATLNY